jgi:hypothetical protein
MYSRIASELASSLKSCAEAMGAALKMAAARKRKVLPLKATILR